MVMPQSIGSGISACLLIALALGACGKVKQNKPDETAQTRAEAKRHKDACSSKTAYDRMKRAIFDQARGRQDSHRANLDTLESFSFVGMEEPVVEGWDPTLDITRCNGRFILDVPPGVEQALGGQRRLSADIAYTAQGAADASGLVYTISGAEPIVSKLAAFNVADATYRPLPALDAEASAVDVTRADDQPTETFRSAASPPGETEPSPAMRRTRRETQSARSELPMETVLTASPSDLDVQTASEGTVRSFYNALGSGNGEIASAQVIPSKRSSRAYSADAISRFYGRMIDPLRLTSIRPLPSGAYHVSYRYAGAGVRCNGTATVRQRRRPPPHSVNYGRRRLLS
jgi:hypothetical protein